MHITAVRYHNFRLLKDAGLTIQPGLFFIGGVNNDVPEASSNMAGKSTLITGLVWALYGTDLSGNRISDNAVTEGQDAAHVTVEFTRPDGTAGTVERWRFNKAVGTGESKNQLAVTLWGESYAGAAEQVQCHVDALFGPLPLFLAAHVFAHDATSIPFADTPDREQKRIFDLLIGVADLDGALERATAAARQAGIRVAQARDSVVALEARQEERKERTQALTQAAAVPLGVLRDVLRSDAAYRAAQRAVAASAARPTTADARLDDARKVLRHAELQWAEKRSTLLARKAKLEAARDALERPINAIDRLMNHTMHKPTERVQCPTCRCTLHRDQWYTVMKDDAAELEKVNTQIAQQAERIDKMTRTQECVFNALRQDIEDAQREAERATYVHSLLVSRQQDALTANREAHTALRIYRTHQAEAMAEAQEALQAVGVKLAQATEEQATAQAELDRCAFWVEAFGPRGIRAFRLDQITPQLNAIAEGYSGALFGDGTVLRYSTQTKNARGEYRDKFEAALYRKTKSGYTKITAALSAGQGMRRDIIHTFSMVELAAGLGKRSTQLLVLDELFATVDAKGIDAAIAVLHRMTGIAETIFVVEHNEDLRANFPDAITVERTGNTSTIYQ